MRSYEKLAAAIEAKAAEWEASGCYALVKDGETAFTRVFGYAERETGTPITEQSRYCITQYAPFLLGLCLLRLEEQKKLRLTDSLSRYIPEYPLASRLTLHQMLQAAAGIPDYMTACVCVQLESDPVHQARSEEERYRFETQRAAYGASFAEAFEMVKDMPLEYEAGSEDSSVNASVCVFLGEVIARVTGRTLYESEKTLLFDPLGMNVPEGDCSDTGTMGCILDDQRVPLDRGEARFVLTLDLPNMLLFAKALADGALLSKKQWRQALRYSEWGWGDGFELLNGADGAYVYGPHGYSLAFAFSQKERMCYFTLLNESPLYRKTEGEWDAFRPAARRETEGFLQRYTAPRFMRPSPTNVWMAMRLRVAPEQDTFVLDARSSLAAASGIRTWRPLILTDCGRALGLLVLNIDKKNDIYEIAIVLIDRRFQGKGYGRFMIRYAVDELKKAGAKRLVIGVNRHNPVARHLYESVGFTACNVYDEGVELALEL